MSRTEFKSIFSCSVHQIARKGNRNPRFSFRFPGLIHCFLRTIPLSRAPAHTREIDCFKCKARRASERKKLSNWESNLENTCSLCISRNAFLIEDSEHVAVDFSACLFICSEFRFHSPFIVHFEPISCSASSSTVRFPSSSLQLFSRLMC